MKVREELKNPQLNYATMSKKMRFEIDVPNEEAAKGLPDEYECTSKTQRTKRYQTLELRQLIEQLRE